MLYFTIQNLSRRSHGEGLRSGGCEMTILSSIIVGYRRISSDYPRIILESSLYWRKHFRHFHLRSSLQDFVAGAVFGEVGGWLYLLRALEMTFHMWRRSMMTFILRGRRSIWWSSTHGNVWLFVAGAALRDILGDSRSAKCCILQYKIVSKMGRVRSPKRRVRDDDFMVGYRRISSDYPRRIVFLLAEARFSWNFHEISWQAQYLVWRVIFAWQAQYLVRLEGDLTLLRALEMTFHMWRRSLMTFILRGRRSIWWGWRVTFAGRRSTSWHFGR